MHSQIELFIALTAFSFRVYATISCKNLSSFRHSKALLPNRFGMSSHRSCSHIYCPSAWPYTRSTDTNTYLYVYLPLRTGHARCQSTHSLVKYPVISRLPHTAAFRPCCDLGRATCPGKCERILIGALCLDEIPRAEVKIGSQTQTANSTKSFRQRCS